MLLYDELLKLSTGELCIDELLNEIVGDKPIDKPSIIKYPILGLN